MYIQGATTCTLYMHAIYCTCTCNAIEQRLTDYCSDQKQIVGIGKNTYRQKINNMQTLVYIGDTLLPP